VAARVLPSPVAISATHPRAIAQAPMTWTWNGLWPISRVATSRITAKPRSRSLDVSRPRRKTSRRYWASSRSRASVTSAKVFSRAITRDALRRNLRLRTRSRSRAPRPAFQTASAPCGTGLADRCMPGAGYGVLRGRTSSAGPAWPRSTTVPAGVWDASGFGPRPAGLTSDQKPPPAQAGLGSRRPAPRPGPRWDPRV